MQLPHERNLAFKNQGDMTELLYLASEHVEDEYGNSTYTFSNPNARAVLNVGYGVDVEVEVYIPAQSEPLVAARIDACKEFRVIEDKRGQQIEFIGDLASLNQGHIHQVLKAGFRLMLKPVISLQLFFVEQ